jgi:DNA-binding beta-propeller fold protein YncE
VIRVNQSTGAQSLVVSNDKMHYSLTSITVAPSGEIDFGDEDQPDPPYNDSVVYGANPQTGKLRIVTSDTKSVKAGGIHRDEDPLGLVYTPDGGTLYVLADVGGDDNAPTTPNDFVGAVVAVNPQTGKQTLVTSNYYSKQHGGQALFADPRAMVRAPNGDLYIVDDRAINDSRYHASDTKVIKVDPKTGRQTLISNNAKSLKAGGKALFYRPYGIAFQANGQLLVDDGQRLLRVNPKTGAQSLVTTGLGNAIGIVAIP